MSSPICSILFSLILIAFASVAVVKAQVPVTPGLSKTFYKSSCPNLTNIVRGHLNKVFKNDSTQAAGLLRLHFHDCFVQGCDGSVLLDGSTSGPSEQNAPPNLTLRPVAFKIINDLQALIQAQCPSVVSCADITALAARDSVFLLQKYWWACCSPKEKIVATEFPIFHDTWDPIGSVVVSGGPKYTIPLGRRDGLNFATTNDTLANLPSPFMNITTILNAFSQKNLTTTDTVALSGAHTIGISHCTSFTNRLYPTQASDMDQTFASNLKLTCPATNTTNTTNMDIRSPNIFDNKYFVDLMNRQTLFTTDQGLYNDSRTKSIVKNFAVNQTLFFEKFIEGMVKMGQLGVLTGPKGRFEQIALQRMATTLAYGLWWKKMFNKQGNCQSTK